ncbi:Integrase core domain protein [Synechococcus sp. PCC 7335]|uniref:IS6 family transposase n=1 Tax=Synechococcus sp. (strain ATCC 29403 / PCC 7335) TaxID=91464 RepID=UPI00017ED9ED|nr:IS6 family transposase [Synechococcus sp. PCC 7335]EDX83245.1 Integrase core domain protein [Synechococcus sp. PCC 7335]
MNNPYRGHRFPADIISYCVWLYYTFPLSFRDIEKMMLYRGITVTYEAIRSWCHKFAQSYANQIRKQRPKPGDKWHLDEVVIKIKGEQFYLWRAVDQHGVVLDILMQRCRNKAAAKKFFRKLLKPAGFAPRVIITDKLKSYGAAKKDILRNVEHRQHKGLNNRAENSHRQTRVRERRMGRFKSVGQAQRFLSAFEPIRGHFHPHQHKQTASEYRKTMRQRMESWRSLTETYVIA